MIQAFMKKMRKKDYVSFLLFGQKIQFMTRKKNYRLSSRKSVVFFEKHNIVLFTI